MPKIKAVAIDLDGTLLNSKDEISNNSVVEIQRIYKTGVHVIIATTRNYFYVCPLCEELGISDPLICSNGAQIYSKPGGPMWKEYTIPLKVASSIAELTDKNNWELSTTVNSTIYWKRRPGQKLGMVRPNIVTVKKNQDALSEEPLKILTWQIEAADALEKLCKERFSMSCKTEVYYKPTGEFHSFGIFPVGADKGTALDYVLQKLSIDRKNVMAIGDNNNDLTMLRVAELTVAMRNGTMEIKRMAKVVAPSNDEDGVVWALKEYVSELPQLLSHCLDDKNL